MRAAWSGPAGSSAVRRRLTVSAAAVLLLTVSACGAQDVAPSAGAPQSTAASPSTGMEGDMGGHPTAPACPPLPQISEPPQRVVTMDGGAAAILSRLGLAERIVGTAAPDFFTAFTGAEKEQLSKIPVLDKGQGNAEAVIAARPDLVVGISTYSFGGFDGTPSVEALAKAGAKALVACESAGGGPVKDLSVTGSFIKQVAAVFEVEDAGTRLVAQIQASIDQAKRSAPAQPVKVLALSGAPTAGQPVMTQGGASLANGVITVAGGQNIAEDVPMDFASLSAEEIVTRDPQAIVVISGFTPGSDEDLLTSIRSSPVLAATTAVRENRLVVVPQSILLSPSVLNGDAVATIAETLRAAAA